MLIRISAALKVWLTAILACPGELPEVVKILALILPLRAIHSIFADALTGAGFQRLRSLIQVGVAVFNVALNFWVISRYSWRGAAWSSAPLAGSRLKASSSKLSHRPFTTSTNSWERS